MAASRSRRLARLPPCECERPVEIGVVVICVFIVCMVAICMCAFAAKKTSMKQAEAVPPPPPDYA